MDFGSSDVSFWLNAAGLASGTFGTALIYFFGVPRQVDTGGVNFLSLEGASALGARPCRVPDSFYEQIHRVWGWEYKPGNVKRNSYIGKLTNLLVYDKMAPGVKEELRKRNPVDPKTKRRTRTHHEYLTEDIGHPHLEKQLNAVTTLLRATPDGKPAFFQKLFNTAFPPRQGELFPDYDAAP